MEEPQPEGHPGSPQQTLSRCSSGRRRTTTDTSSPEFEFWMVRNPNCPQPNLHSADELFSDGFLLPLHLLRLSNTPPPTDEEPSGSGQYPEPQPEPNSSVELPDDDLMVAAPSVANSKRWRHIFKKNVKKTSDASAVSRAADNRGAKGARVMENRREKKMFVGASNMVSAAELNITLWPFSRSRSAGNGGTRPRAAGPVRKVSSAPCSRSNSVGESKSRKWANSPTRVAGVHLGRSSPVWQVRRGGGRSSDAAGVKSKASRDAIEARRKILPAASKAKVLSLNVPMCIGYRQNLSCRTDEYSSVNGGGGGGVASERVRRSNPFNIRSLFTRKVY